MATICTNIFVKLFVSSILFGFHDSFTNGISVNSMQERSCIQPTVDPSFNISWAVSVSEWFFPIWSTYEVYRWTTIISGFDEKDISPELIDTSCQVLYLNPAVGVGALHVAFAGTRKIKIELNATSPGIFDWVEVTDNGTNGSRGRSYVTLSDNNSFDVTVSCWSEDIRSYVVHATNKSLDEQTKKTIKEHLSALGFDVDNNLYEMSYDNCVSLPPLEPTKAATTSPAAGVHRYRRSTSGSEMDQSGLSAFGPFRAIGKFIGSKLQIFAKMLNTMITFLLAPIRLIMGFLGNNNGNGRNSRNNKGNMFG